MSRYSKIRSNRAIEDWTSTEVWSIEPIGKNRRLCSVVKATMVPASKWAEPLAVTIPATRYTSAGVIEKKICTMAKKVRPIICWRISSPARRSFSLRNRPIS